MRSWFVALSCLLLAAGCSTDPSAPSGAVDLSAVETGAHQAAWVYQPQPPRIDDDSDFDPPDSAAQLVLHPMRAIGRGFGEMFAGPEHALEMTSGDTPRKAFGQMRDRQSADARRNGLNRLLEFPFTHRPPYTQVYEAMARDDADPTVRAAAIRACNRSRDAHATPIFIAALSDKNMLIRLEAAKALANVPDPRAVGSLIALASNPDQNRDVRVAAADALKYTRTLQVARVLSTLLTDPDFSVTWQARRSLIYLTHRDFGYDQGAWLGYFVGPEKPLG